MVETTVGFASFNFLIHVTYIYNLHIVVSWLSESESCVENAFRIRIMKIVLCDVSVVSSCVPKN